ncbi:hypothetical protein Adt_06498 [Abeliophyllum distichum]|uniref:Uncharacterized protein n=1 Tax=Abeliophyllum distichum TaxID=126358 RepID=A0ABD1V735_9LAMI
MALNQAVLAAGLRLPLREWRIAPTQLCPNGWRILLGFHILWNQLGFPRPLAKEFNSLYSFKSDGKRSGWWYASVKAKTGGYISHDPTPESIERARRARAVDESFRSSGALITEDNLSEARLSPTTSHRPRPLRARPHTKEAPKSVPSPARSIEEITSISARGEPFSSPASRPPPSLSRILPTYLGSTSDRDEEYLKLHGSIPKPVCDFFRSNSPTRGDIVELSSSARRAINVMGKSWTPVQQKYLDGIETVESIVAASVNTSRVAIQLTSAAEKMGRMLTDIQELEVERKTHAELRTALGRSVDKEEVVAEFKSSDAYLAEQEMVYFLMMEELIETTVEKRPDWDVQFLRDELFELKRKSTLNPPSPEEVDQDQTSAEE